MTDLTVSKTILQQLGGRHFIAMTGTKNFVGDADHLAFSLPPNKSKANKMKIKLTPMDTYTVTTYRINLRAKNAEDVCREVETVENVYEDNLQDVFTSLTGMYTRL